MLHRSSVATDLHNIAAVFSNLHYTPWLQLMFYAMPKLRAGMPDWAPCICDAGCRSNAVA